MNTELIATVNPFTHPLEALNAAVSRRVSDRADSYLREIADCEEVMSGRLKAGENLMALAQANKRTFTACLNELGNLHEERVATITNLYEVFGEKSVLLPIPHCKKGPVLKMWQKTTFLDTCFELYADSLLYGNIGLLQGSASQNLISVDVDEDRDFIDFLELNPRLSRSVKTRGSRGGNLWLRMTGEYPRVCPVKRRSSEEKWGEFRGTGGQTVVYGRHPTFVDYKILSTDQQQEIVECDFDEIIWPEIVIAPQRSTAKDSIAAAAKTVLRRTDKGRPKTLNSQRSTTNALKEQFDLSAFAVECIPGAAFHSNGVMISCPFHVEQTPSCYVEEDHFHCFGCAKSGDAFSLIMQFYRISFQEALSLVKKVIASGLMRA